MLHTKNDAAAQTKLVMDKKARRNKSEQFRKSRNNYFHRGYDICRKSEAKMLVLIERKGKYYRFLSSDSLLHLSEEEIVSKGMLPLPLRC